MPDLFHKEKLQGIRSHGRAIFCLQCIDNGYTKYRIMIIITHMALMVQSANDQLGGNNGKTVYKENTKKCKVVTCSCPRSR